MGCSGGDGGFGILVFGDFGNAEGVVDAGDEVTAA